MHFASKKKIRFRLHLLCLLPYVIVKIASTSLDEDYGNVITTFNNFTNISLVKVESTLLEDERKINTREVGFAHVKEEEALFTKNKFKGKNKYSVSPTMDD